MLVRFVSQLVARSPPTRGGGTSLSMVCPEIVEARSGLCQIFVQGMYTGGHARRRAHRRARTPYRGQRGPPARLGTPLRPAAARAVAGRIPALLGGGRAAREDDDRRAGARDL